MFSITQKMKMIKLQLKYWSKTSLWNTHAKLLLNTQKLSHVESQLLSHPNSYRLNSWLH